MGFPSRLLHLQRFCEYSADRHNGCVASFITSIDVVRCARALLDNGFGVKGASGVGFLDVAHGGAVVGLFLLLMTSGFLAVPRWGVDSSLSRYGLDATPFIQLGC